MSILDEVLGLKKKAVDYFNPTSNKGRNFWSTPAAKPLAWAQKGTQAAARIPQVNLQPSASRIQAPVLRFAAQNVAAPIAQSFINSPANYLKGISEAGQYLGSTYANKQPLQLSRLGAKVAPTGEAILNVASLGLGKQALKQATKLPFKQAVVKEGLKGAGWGSLYGGVAGLGQSEDMTPAEAFRTIALSAGGGALAGGALGAGAGAAGGALGYVKGVASKGYRELHPEASEEQVTRFVNGFMRNELGQFAKQKKKVVWIRDPYINEADVVALRKKLGLPDRYDSGAIDLNAKISLKPTQATKGVPTEVLPEKPPWEAPEFSKPAKPKITLQTDEQAIAEGAVKGGLPTDTTKRMFADWVNTRKASRVEGVIKSREFQDLDSKGLGGILEFQSGKKGSYSKVTGYFDAKYDELKKAGVKMGYKQEYLPQLWADSPEKVQQVLGNRLGKRASFTLQSVIKDYQEGIDLGLTPRFNKISDLVGWYESTANKSLADINFFKTLTKENLIMSHGKAPRDWVTLDADRFPALKVMTPEGAYSGTYKAPPELAEMVNNYLRNPQLPWLESIANYASRVKNMVLSFGIPYTGINAHGFNILARSTLSGRNPVMGFLRGAHWMVNPRSAERFVNANLKSAPKAVKNGLTFAVEDHRALTEDPGIVGKFGQTWNNLFEKPLFEKMIPALKLNYYDDLVKGGMDEREAAKVANNIFGGFNWEQVGKSKDMQNLKRALILAPDWLESNLRVGGNVAKSLFNWKSPAGSAYRRFAVNLTGAYVVANATNKMLSGHYLFENEPGHTFELDTGTYTPDGQKRYIRPFGTGADFVRIPFDVAVGLVKGDPSSAFRAARNRLSIPGGVAMGLLTNTDYRGKPIYGRTQYGQPMEPLQSVGGVAGELSQLFMPSFGKQAIDYATGKQGPEQALTQSFELPFRYTGGAYSKTQKEIAQIAKEQGLKGKELYDLNKQTSGASPLSERQTQLAKDVGIGYVPRLLEQREKAKAGQTGGVALAKESESGSPLLDTIVKSNKKGTDEQALADILKDPVLTDDEKVERIKQIPNVDQLLMKKAKNLTVEERADFLQNQWDQLDEAKLVEFAEAGVLTDSVLKELEVRGQIESWKAWDKAITAKTKLGKKEAARTAGKKRSAAINKAIKAVKVEYPSIDKIIKQSGTLPAKRKSPSRRKQTQQFSRSMENLVFG